MAFLLSCIFCRSHGNEVYRSCKCSLGARVARPFLMDVLFNFQGTINLVKKKDLCYDFNRLIFFEKVSAWQIVNSKFSKDRLFTGGIV